MIRKPLLLTIFCGLSLLTLVGVFALPWNGLSLIDRWREMRTGRIVYAVPTRERVVALTFDDGPDPRYTGRVLDVLKAQRVRATFFVCGRMLAAHPDLGRRIAAEGHVLGNHTETHPHLEWERDPAARRELELCDQQIRTITGQRPTLFRPPRGLWNPTVFADARRQGYTIVLWSLAFDRRAIHDSGALRRRIVRLARPGDILLLHDGSASRADERAPTVRELKNVIIGLKRRGFRFVTVPELLRFQGHREAKRPSTVLARR